MLHSVGSLDSISTKDLMEKTHQLPISVFFLLRGYPGICNLLDSHVALHYAMRDVKDMGQQMGYHSL